MERIVLNPSIATYENIYEGSEYMTLDDSFDVILKNASINGYTEFAVSLRFHYNDTAASSFEIYRGRAVWVNDYPKIHLNDIIETYIYSPEKYIQPYIGYDTTSNNFTCYTKSVTDWIFDIEVVVKDITYVYENVMAIHKPLRHTGVLQHYPSHWGTNAGYDVRIVNTRDMLYDVLPVIPLVGTANTPMFAAGIICPSNDYCNANMIADADDPGEKIPVLRITGADQNNDEIFKAYGDGSDVQIEWPKTYAARAYNNCMAVNVNYDIINNLAEFKSLNLFDTVGVAAYNRPSEMEKFKDTYVPLAKIDRCPAEYYLIWTNRSMSYQCQPFSKRNIMQENVKTTLSVNAANEHNPAMKNIEYTWKLNSDWLNFEQYNEFESLLLSPVVYLYDTVYKRMHKVIITSSKWEDKNIKNCKKPFSLSVDVKKAEDENILC